MKNHASIVAVAALLFLFTLIFGLYLSRNLTQNDPRASGQPLAGALPAVHKLAALAAVIALVLLTRSLHRGAGFTGIEWPAVVISGFFFLSMFVTGSLLSLGKPANEVVQVVHKTGAVLTLISTSAAIYFLTRTR